MKSKFLLSVVLLGVLGAAPAAMARSVPSGYEKDVLTLVDLECGDSWCEGDLNFEFTRFTCNFSAGTCKLSFLANEHDLAEQVRGDCRFTGYFAETDLLDRGEVHGHTSTRLRDSILKDVGECLNNFERSIRVESL